MNKPLGTPVLVKTNANDSAIVAAFLADCLKNNSFRCGCCLNHHTELCNIGLYKSKTSAVAYGICNNCWNKAISSQSAMRRFLARCESYMGDDAE